MRQATAQFLIDQTLLSRAEAALRTMSQRRPVDHNDAADRATLAAALHGMRQRKVADTPANEDPEHLRAQMKATQMQVEALRRSFVDAIEFAINPDTVCGDDFLRAWMHGDWGVLETEWPEFDMASTRAAQENAVADLLKAEDPAPAAQDAVHGEAVIAGQVTTREPEGEPADHPFALLLSFRTGEEVRTALDQGRCTFSFGPDADATLQDAPGHVSR